MKGYSLILILHSLLFAKGFLKSDPEYINRNEDPGSPLILTSYIESGKIEEARNLSRVKLPGFPKVDSYAGFFTVDKTYDSNQFFWYFPPMNKIEVPGVILWLQGGPGVSSLYGLFTENGPFQVIRGSLHQRDIHWAEHNHLIYIDNPVGTGFSFTNDSRGYCTNQTQIGEHLYTTMIQFFQLFPELQKLPFYVSGESYAGKYVPALGYTIHKSNPVAKIKINLQGLLIGNGWSDPINQHDYSDYLYQIGLMDWDQKKITEDYQNKVIELIRAKAWTESSAANAKLINYIAKCASNISIYNYLPSKLDFEDESYVDLIQTVSIRRAIHVGNLAYDSYSNIVNDALNADKMQSVAPLISELLEHYHILIYNGQLDIIVAYPLTVNFLRKLNFSASEEYLKAERLSVFIQEEKQLSLLGFMKVAGKLSELLIRNAGHMVPADQPFWIYNLMMWWRFNIAESVEDKSLDKFDGTVVLDPNLNNLSINQLRLNVNTAK